MACLCGSCTGVGGLSESKCKLFIKKNNEKHNWVVDHLVRGFWCSKCDRNVGNSDVLYSINLHQRGVPCIEFNINLDYLQLLSLFFKLLCCNSSEEVQVAYVGIMRRMLAHGTPDVLLKTRSEWMKCIDFLLFHRNKVVREAFSTQISFFLDEAILNCLFVDDEAAEKTKGQKFLDKIKHALAATDDPHLFETLLEATSEIMVAVDIHNHLFLFSLILLVDQLDSPHVTVRMTASRLIHKSCFFHLKGGLEAILVKVAQIRCELYEYLSLRLATRPNMVKEFAAAVLGIETKELVGRMIPTVLPKLVTSQENNDQAVVTLYELASCLNMDMVQLIVNWLPKVLAFALHQADGQDLESALQFYHEHTGSDNKEIFAAALPALLDELLCFMDEGDSDETKRRY